LVAGAPSFLQQFQSSGSHPHKQRLDNRWNIEARDGHLSTGFIGTKDLMLALAKIVRDDVASWLIHNDMFLS